MRIFALALLCTACNAPSPSADWAGSIDSSGPLVLVRNPAQPIVPDSGMALVVACQSAPETFELPHGLASLEDTIYVLDAVARRIHKLDPATCATMATFGSGGAGPGELLRPLGILAFGDGIAVLDAGRRSLEQYGADGTHLGSRPLGATTFYALPWAGDALVMQLRRDWLPVRLGPDGSVSVVSLGREVDDSASGPLRDCPLLTPSGSRVIAGCRSRLEYFVFDTGTGPLRRVLVDRPEVERSDSAVDAYVEAQMALSVGLPDSLMRNLATLLRREATIRQSFRRPVVDPGTGMVAILDQDADAWNPDHGVVGWFTRDGKFLTETRTEGPWTEFLLQGQALWAIEQMPSGEAVVRRYQFDWAPALVPFIGDADERR